MMPKKGLTKMKKVFYAVGAGLTCFAGNAFAAVDLTGIVVDTATPEDLAGIILGGLAVIWGIRKVIKIMNRS